MILDLDSYNYKIGYGMVCRYVCRWKIDVTESGIVK